MDFNRKYLFLLYNTIQNTIHNIFSVFELIPFSGVTDILISRSYVFCPLCCQQFRCVRLWSCFIRLDYFHNFLVIMVVLVLSFSLRLDSPSGSRIPHRWGFDTTLDPTHWPLPLPVQHTTTIRDRPPCPSGIRSSNHSKRETVDPRLRPQGQRY